MKCCVKNCDKEAIGNQSDAYVDQNVCEKHACLGLRGLKSGERITGVTVCLTRFPYPPPKKVK